jgi:hypothetical protein
LTERPCPKRQIETTSEPVDVDASHAAPSVRRSRVTAHHQPPARPPNDAQKLAHWCGLRPAMGACNCSGHKSDGGARLTTTAAESAGRILPTLLLSLARPWIENRPNGSEYQWENSFCSRRPPDGPVCTGTRMVIAGSHLRWFARDVRDHGYPGGGTVLEPVGASPAPRSQEHGVGSGPIQAGTVL